MNPDDPFPARSFMEATQRALAVYGEAYKRSGGNAEGSQSSEMSICEDVYPAILYNAAVFHEVSEISRLSSLQFFSVLRIIALQIFDADLLHS